MSEKKTISVMIPCYNEEQNARPIYEAVRDELVKSCPNYDYEILFIDNKSEDGTRAIIRQICAEDKHVKAIFNVKNFGQFNSPYYGMIHTSGDCTITMCADFQDPVEMIPRFVAEWEKGYKIVIGRKTQSKENPVMYWLRGCYYKLIKKMSSCEQIEQFTGFGLYDKSFIQTLRNLKDPTPFIRGIVAELGPERKEIEYTQPQRRAEFRVFQEITKLLLHAGHWSSGPKLRRSSSTTSGRFMMRVFIAMTYSPKKPRNAS